MYNSEDALAKHKELLLHCHQVMVEKTKEWGKNEEPFENLYKAAAFGTEPWRGALMRMEDKLNKFVRLANGNAPRHEAMGAIADVINYADIAYLLWLEQKLTTGDERIERLSPKQNEPKEL